MGSSATTACASRSTTRRASCATVPSAWPGWRRPWTARSPSISTNARPWIEKAQLAHPSLVDTRHVLADLYNVVNVPTIFWIDERGRIVRPNDVAFGTDTFKHITGLESARHLTALRAWVRGETPALSAEDVKRHQPLPTAADQQARAAFGV